MSPLRATFLTAPVAVLIAFSGDAEEVPQPAAKPPTVMQRKLSHAQKVLEGLVLPDFEKVTTGADGLTACAREAS